jgi:mannose-6-phosphate isomerase-like protein (cupin superfamily)
VVVAPGISEEHGPNMSIPTAAAGRGYLIRRLDEAPTVPCPCGQSTRLLTIADGPAANFHITSIDDAAAHFHKECTEIYYILEGNGRLELNGEAVEVGPGTLVVIEPFTVHRLLSHGPGPVRTIVLGFPAMKPEDEYLV